MSITNECKAYIKCINKIKTSKNGKPKKLSGYNVFCMETRKTLSGSSTEIMSQLGVLWKSCSDLEKKEFKTKSINKNELALEESDKNFIEEDEQTESLKVLINELVQQFKKDTKKLNKN